MKSTMDDEPTLVEAENQHRNVICSDLIAENLSVHQQLQSLQWQHDNLWRKNDLQQDTTTSLHRELDAVRVDLENTCRCLRSADDEIVHTCDVADNIEHKADKAIGKLKDKNDTLCLQVKWGHTPRRCKLPCHDSLSTSPSRSRHASSCASRHTSPMAEDHSCTSRRPSPIAEDRDNTPSRDVADPPHLLLRLTVHSTATSSATSLPLGELPQPSPIIPSPSEGADLASRMTDAISLAPLGDDRETATPFIESVGFYASFPVLQFYGRHYKCTAIDHAGTFDYSSPFFILADRQLTKRGPSFITMLLWREFVQTHEASIQAGIPLPVMDLILGGRNGVLILSHDPSNKAGITALLTTLSRHAHAKGYINRIQNTPPELHEECHQKALELWAGLQDVRRKEQHKGCIASGGVPPLPKEPLPHVSTTIWKKWLQNIHEHPCTEGWFTLKGVPFVCNGYLNVHVDAARALLALLPLLSKKSCPGTIHGPLWDAFLRSAAMLLNVHGMYGETITRLRLTITPQRRAHFYNPSKFADESHLNCEHVARFLASVGVTVAKAETWQ